MSAHTNCTHPATAAGRAACRKAKAAPVKIDREAVAAAVAEVFALTDNDDDTDLYVTTPAGLPEHPEPQDWAAEAVRYRNRAKASRQSAYDSFDRCDTDGFLSQWASDQMASRYDHAATFCDRGGFITRVALFDLAGNLVSTQRVNGRFSDGWRIADAEGQTICFVNESKASTPEKRRAALVKKGYVLGTILTAGFVNPKDSYVYPIKGAVDHVISADDLGAH